MQPLPTILFGVAVVPTIVGIVQAFKTAGLPTPFAPLLAILLGLAAGALQLLAAAPSSSALVATDLAEGLALGLSAAGLYSGSQAAGSPLLATITSWLSQSSIQSGPAAHPAGSSTTPVSFSQTIPLPNPPSSRPSVAQLRAGDAGPDNGPVSSASAPDSPPPPAQPPADTTTTTGS